MRLFHFEVFSISAGMARRSSSFQLILKASFSLVLSLSYNQSIVTLRRHSCHCWFVNFNCYCRSLLSLSKRLVQDSDFRVKTAFNRYETQYLFASVTFSMDRACILGAAWCCRSHQHVDLNILSKYFRLLPLSISTISPWSMESTFNIGSIGIGFR